MLLQFTLGNFYSIKDPVTLNMLAVKPIKEFEASNVFEADRYRLLTSAIIYGANASGKSYFLKGMDFIKWFIINSSKETQKDERINIERFRLSPSTKKKPSFFEISILIDNTKYRYGFEVDRNNVREEWLFYSRKIKEYPLFIRDIEGIEVFTDFPEGNGLEERTRNNALFLSVAAQFNGLIAGKIIDWFHSFYVISGLEDIRYQNFTVKKLRDPGFKSILIKFLNAADLSIKDIQVKEIDIKETPFHKNIPVELRNLILKSSKEAYTIITYHEILNEKGEVIGTEAFDFESSQSEGTKKYFRLAGPVIDTLQKGEILIIDELDARLHPIMTKWIVKFFNSKVTNPKNAQFVFATHDTNLLSACTFRRDQIWFTEKTKQNATALYSLAEYKLPKGKVRKDASIEKDYMKGKYGAIPFIGDFVSPITEIWQE
ncbi:MAG: ATP-binding protein [Bacteroidales bacterium]|nr:ATP-binding protein [Bacteroidales bacterium]